MSCDVGKVTERLENELCPTSQALHLIQQASRPCFNIVTMSLNHFTMAGRDIAFGPYTTRISWWMCNLDVLLTRIVLSHALIFGVSFELTRHFTCTMWCNYYQYHSRKPGTCTLFSQCSSLVEQWSQRGATSVTYILNQLRNKRAYRKIKSSGNLVNLSISGNIQLLLLGRSQHDPNIYLSLLFSFRKFWR